MSSWVRYRFAHLRRWREYANAIARAVEDLAPGSRVYIVGSVARGTYGVTSDIDVLIVVPRGRKGRGLYRRIMERAMDLYGLPFDAPVELHIVEEGGEAGYLEEGYIEVEARV